MAKKKATTRKTGRKRSARKNKAETDAESRTVSDGSAAGSAETRTPEQTSRGSARSERPSARRAYPSEPISGKRKRQQSPNTPGDPPEILAPIDPERVRTAIARYAAGKSLSPPQREARDAFEPLAELWAEHVPKGRYQAWAGAQSSQLNRQAKRYGLPIDGRTVSIPALAASIQRFLAKNARNLKAAGVDPAADAGGIELDDDGNVSEGVTSPALERYRSVRADAEELKYRRMLGEVVEREKVDAAFGVVSAALERSRRTLARSFGSKASSVLDSALEEIAREVAEALRADHESDDQDGEA